jgi:hypothetical protein
MYWKLWDLLSWRGGRVHQVALGWYLLMMMVLAIGDAGQLNHRQPVVVKCATVVDGRGGDRLM